MIQCSKISIFYATLGYTLCNNSTRQIYYSLLQKTHETNDFFPYLKWFINLIHTASLRSTTRALKVRVAMLEVKKKIREIDRKLYSQDLVNVLFRGPIIFANHLVHFEVAGSISTAHSYLKKLESSGLLIRSPRKYNRKTGYINNHLLNALSGEVDLSE